MDFEGMASPKVSPGVLTEIDKDRDINLPGLREAVRQFWPEATLPLDIAIIQLVDLETLVAASKGRPIMSLSPIFALTVWVSEPPPPSWWQRLMAKVRR